MPTSHEPRRTEPFRAGGPDIGGNVIGYGDPAAASVAKVKGPAGCLYILLKYRLLSLLETVSAKPMRGFTKVAIWLQRVGEHTRSHRLQHVAFRLALEAYALGKLGLKFSYAFKKRQAAVLGINEMFLEGCEIVEEILASTTRERLDAVTKRHEEFARRVKAIQ